MHNHTATSPLCLDASFVGKILLRESDSKMAEELLEAWTKQSYQFIAPDFLKLEIYSLLRKQCHFKRIEASQVQAILLWFHRLVIHYYPFDKILLEASYSISEQLGLPVIYDSLYLALSQETSGCLVTADEQFARKAQKVFSNVVLFQSL